MKRLLLMTAAAIVFSQSSVLGQRTCLSGCNDGNRVSVTFDPRAAQQLFDSLFFRLDSLTAHVEACGCASGSSGAPGSSGGGSSGGGAFTCGTSTVTFDGHDYSTVAIGSQCWFAENLRTTKYNDDTDIPSGLDNAAWLATTNGAMTIYDEGGENEATNLATYGRLYNFHAVTTGKLCPSGWHVPTNDELTALTNHLGGASVAGGEMKSSASDDPAWDGTNSSGFSGLPGGQRWDYGGFGNVGVNGYLWTSSSYNNLNAWSPGLVSMSNEVIGYLSAKRAGLTVRCVRD